MATLSHMDGDDDGTRLEQKRFALSLFAQVLQSVNVCDAMRACFAVQNGFLRAGDGMIELKHFSNVLIAAIGKAAVPMAEHALSVLQPILPVRGVVVGVGSWANPEGITYIEGGHPVPDERSFAAAHALLSLMQSADEATLVVFLISGGASAMAEAPLGPAVPQQDLVEFYKSLLHSGLPISSTNTLRKHLSAIKGGRLALASGEATRCTVLISDVPPGKLDVVGSGPSLPDTSTVLECRKLLAATPSLAPATPALKSFFDAMPESPKRLPEGRQASICFSALSSDSLIQAAGSIARQAGYRVVVDNSCDDWDYRDAARYLFERAVDEAVPGERLCVLSAGEVTVSIEGKAGLGGRNQQWALELARHLSGRAGMFGMSAGSDGIDGNSSAAGAIVDSTTWQRAESAGLDPRSAMETFNTNPLFLALGDAVICGPSGNNLRDLRVILVDPI